MGIKKRYVDLSQSHDKIRQQMKETKKVKYFVDKDGIERTSNFSKAIPKKDIIKIC